jgi:phage shock protein C
VSPRRLYRSRRDRQLAGVAGGIAEYLDVDPTVVRILWILSIFFGGFSILVYIVMAFIVPLEPAAGQAPGWGPGGPARGSNPAGPAWGAAPAATGAQPGEPGEAGTETSPEGAPAGSYAADGAAAWGASPAWTAPVGEWQPPAERRPGRGGLVVGVLLVVFGSIALAGVLVPGWVAWPALGPVFLVALGVALLVGATRRSTAAS